MAIGSIGTSSALTTYQLPVGPSAKATDEQSESPAVRAREASTGKEAPVPSSAPSGGANGSGGVDLKV